MKKKLMALGMAAVLAFGAAGCGGGTDAKTDDTALEDFNIVLDWIFVANFHLDVALFCGRGTEPGYQLSCQHK